MSDDGFVPEDFAHVRDAICGAMLDCDERRLRALLSNNVNIIVAALKRVAVQPRPAADPVPPRAEVTDGLSDAAFALLGRNLADMVTEWVENGLKLNTDWRNGLAETIERRLRRVQRLSFEAALATPAPKDPWRAMPVPEGMNKIIGWVGAAAYCWGCNGDWRDGSHSVVTPTAWQPWPSEGPKS